MHLPSLAGQDVWAWHAQPQFSHGNLNQQQKHMSLIIWFVTRDGSWSPLWTHICEFFARFVPKGCHGSPADHLRVMSPLLLTSEVLPAIHWRRGSGVRTCRRGLGVIWNRLKRVVQAPIHSGISPTYKWTVGTPAGKTPWWGPRESFVLRKQELGLSGRTPW